jgi:hypothetical protein
MAEAGFVLSIAVCLPAAAVVLRRGRGGPSSRLASPARASRPTGVRVLTPGVGRMRQNLRMATEVSVRLGSANRIWITLRGSTNPFASVGGPLPRVIIPLEARVPERGIEVDILRLAFDLKIRNLVVGEGEVGPYEGIRTDYNYVPAVASIPHSALPSLVNPEPLQGRITLTLAFKGLVRYRHSYEPGTDLAQGLEAPNSWHIQSIGGTGGADLDVQVARSDWYEQVVEPLAVGSYLVTPLYLPVGVSTWESSLGHLNEALRALVIADPPGVFSACRAAIDALPGNKTDIFAAMPEGARRDAIDELTKRIGIYIHSGRHVVPNAGGQQAGEFPVDQRDAVFAYNMMKLLLSHIASLTLRP